MKCAHLYNGCCMAALEGTFLWHGFAMSRDVVVTNVGFDCAAKKKRWGGESPSIIQERELNGL